MSATNDYVEDRRFSDLFNSEIAEIVYPLTFKLGVSNWEQDTKQATDQLLVFLGRDMAITPRMRTLACRIRRSDALKQYDDQFTIRYERASGVETEHEKIMNGYGDWFFYGHARYSGRNPLPKLSRWWLIDLHFFRDHIKAGRWHQAWMQKNKDYDDSTFKCFRISSFPKALLAGCSEARWPASDVCNIKCDKCGTFSNDVPTPTRDRPWAYLARLLADQGWGTVGYRAYCPRCYAANAHRIPLKT